MQQQKLSKNFQEQLKRYADIQKISAQKQREYVSQAKRRTESMKIEASQYLFPLLSSLFFFFFFLSFFLSYSFFFLLFTQFSTRDK